MNVMEWTTIVNVADNAVITPGAAHADTVTCTIQLRDYANKNLKTYSQVYVYLSDAATGLGLTSTVLTTELTCTTGTLHALVAKTQFLIASDTNGKIVTTMGYTTAAHDYYLVVVLPNGKMVVSSKLEFT